MRKWCVFVSVCFMFVIFLAAVCIVQADYQYKWRMPQVHPVGSDYDLRAIAFAEEVREDETLAQHFGIRGVPYFVVNRKHGISGAQPIEYFVNALTNLFKEESDRSSS